jgi:hypothetical protein
MRTKIHEPASRPQSYKEGQRLYCPICRSEIEIIVPCTGASPGHVVRCCGRDMIPEVGSSVHLESES